MSREWKAAITGASSRIGTAIAAAIASEGSSVCLIGRDLARLEAVAGLSSATARAVLVHEADLNVDGAVKELGQRLRDEFGALDVLVHCAGAFTTGSVEKTPVQQLDLLYRMNVRMPFLLTQELLPLLKARQGQIVFVNSSQGLHPKANSGPFAATQHALKAITDSLRQEINVDGIRVLSIYPGRTATPRMKALYKIEHRSYQPELLLQAEDIAKVVLNSLLLPRTAEVTNVEIRPHFKPY
ncbi:SDR family NAD(P)-dependent oxidoreductase [Bradyrhizobium mercantei]|uniref:SDR family NAD(P)-dependent oxidoreductase n=1 Tax=Bradyrhizobium mercantei TaxID=1904807 RepID=UPI000977CC40|nr:SDR family NAD(P)-dependent oxidoreductase [Bradyrhizobium mercantei]